MLRRSARLHHGLSGPMPSSLRPSSASPSILKVEPCEDMGSLPSIPDGASRRRKGTREQKKRTNAEKRQRKAQRMPRVGVVALMANALGADDLPLEASAILLGFEPTLRPGMRGKANIGADVGGS